MRSHPALSAAAGAHTHAGAPGSEQGLLGGAPGEEPEPQTFYIHITDRGRGRHGLPSVCSRLRSRSDWRSRWTPPAGKNPEDSRNHQNAVNHGKPRPLQGRRAHTYGAVEVDAGDSCVTARQGAFGLTATWAGSGNRSTRGRGQSLQGVEPTGPSQTEHSFQLELLTSDDLPQLHSAVHPSGC